MGTYKKDWQYFQKELGLQQQYQKELNAIQNDYAQENMLLANKLNRQNTIDSAKMQKDSMIKAGISTAGLDNGGEAPSVNATSATPSNAPNVGAAIQARAQMRAQNLSLISSIPDAIQGVLQGMQSINQARLASDQAHYVRAQTDAQKITNTTLAAENMARINGMLKRGDLDGERYQALKRANKLFDATYDAEVSKKFDEALGIKLENNIRQSKLDLMELDKQYKDIQNKLSDKDLERMTFIVSKQKEQYELDKKELLSRVNLNDAKAVEALSNQLLNMAKEYGQKVENQLKEAKIPFAPELAKLEFNSKQNENYLLQHSISIAGEQLKQQEFKTEHMNADRINGLVMGYLGVGADVVKALSN